MNPNNKLDFSKFIGHYSLLYGETNTKKTLITSDFVRYLIEVKSVDPGLISILDFAPKFRVVNKLKIGGRIEDFYSYSRNCKYYEFEGEIIPPRLESNDKNELHKNSCSNFKKTLHLLETYNKHPTSFLIINDLSIFLHSGNKFYLIRTINKAETFFGNSYYGSTINKDFTKLFSLKERLRTEYFIKHIEFSINTDLISENYKFSIS